MRHQNSAIATVALLAACSVDLTDRTPDSFTYDRPLNLQNFAADVEPSGPVDVYGVQVLVGGRVRDLASGAGSRWDGQAYVLPCEEVVTYRFRVRYDDDPRPPFLERTFPETGTFRRVQRGLPRQCEAEARTAAQVFQVNIGRDEIDADPGDGICSIDSQPRATPRCSLRAAVMEANARPGFDLIRLRERRYVLSREGAEDEDRPDPSVGDLDITDAVAIEGGNDDVGCRGSLDDFLDSSTYRDDPAKDDFTKIDGGGNDRVFDIYRGNGEQANVVELECLHVVNGLREEDGGRGGGILNRSVLLLSRVAVTDNQVTGSNRPAGDPPHGSRGAGIFNIGELVMRESAAMRNLGNIGGFVAGGTSGGGLYNAAQAQIEQSVIAFNEAARGPGIFNDRVGEGSGTLVVTNSTIKDNEGGRNARERGSSIYNLGTASIYSSTLEQGRPPGESIDLRRVYANAPGGRLSLWNSLIDANGRPNCESDQGVVSFGGSWFNDSSCVARPVPADTVESLYYPLADDLQDHGGFTPTLELTTDPTHDPTDTALDWPCPPTDQRGFIRPADGNGDGSAKCDPGAFESRARPPTS